MTANFSRCCNILFQDAVALSYFTLTNETSTGVRPPNHQQNGAAFTNFLTMLQYTKSSDHLSMKKLLNLMDDLLEHLEDVMNDEGISFVKCYKNQARWFSTMQPKSLKASAKVPFIKDDALQRQYKLNAKWL